MTDRQRQYKALDTFIFALELTLLLYILYVPIHVYFFPSQWAVEVVDVVGATPTKYTESRPFVDPQPIPQTINPENYEAPIPAWKTYVMALGYVYLKLMRIGWRKAIKNAKDKLKKLYEAIGRME